MNPVGNDVGSADTAATSRSKTIPLHHSITLSALDKYGVLVTNTLVIVLLSRLLSPAEFGAYSIIAAVLLLLQTLREFGGANYIIQENVLTHHSVRSSFTISFLVCILFGLLLYAGRDLCAEFFDAHGLRDGVAVASLNFLLIPFSATITGLLRREMNFTALAICNFFSGLIMAACSVGLAAAGFSYMGPVWGSVAGNAALVALCLAVRPEWRIFYPSMRHARSVLAFGAYSSATVAVNALYQFAPQLILGRTLGLVAVGVYGRAINITQIFDKLIVDVINPVILPAIALNRRSGGDMKHVYAKSLGMITAIHWPFMLVIATLADPLVYVILGSDWLEVVPLVRLLSVASLSLCAACLTYPVLVAMGCVRDTLKASLISVPLSLLVIAGGAQISIEAIAAATLITYPFQAYIALSFIRKRIGTTWHELSRAVRPSLFVTGFTACALAAAVAANGFMLSFSIPGFAGASALALVGWYAGLRLVRHPFLDHLCAARDWALAKLRKTSIEMLGRVSKPSSG